MKKPFKLADIKIGPIKVSEYINKGVARNILFMTATIIVFLSGVVLYGIILNMGQISLKEAMLDQGYGELKNPNIVIDRANYTLELFEDSVFIKSYRANFGKSVHQPKTRAGDGVTPVGIYKICSIDTVHKYRVFLKLNYPNLRDAENALRKGWISQKEFNEIKFQFYYEGCTKYHGVLGGNIGIHGFGRFNYIMKNLPFVFNWTEGSVAVSDEDISELYSVIKIGTRVEIK